MPLYNLHSGGFALLYVPEALIDIEVTTKMSGYLNDAFVDCTLWVLLWQGSLNTITKINNNIFSTVVHIKHISFLSFYLYPIISLPVSLYSLFLDIVIIYFFVFAFSPTYIIDLWFKTYYFPKDVRC